MQTGDEYFDSNEFKHILNDYEKSVKEGQPIFMDIDELIDIADYYNLCGEKNKATIVLNTALELNPGATLPLVFKAREAIANEDIETAKRYANEITDKNDYEYIILKAEIMVAQDKIDSADKYLRKIFSSTEANDVEDFIYDITSMYIEYGVYDKAYEWISECRDIDNTECLELRGKSLIGIGKYDDGIVIFEKLLDLNPRSSKYWEELANAQYLNDEYNDAITSCEYSLALNPQAQGSLLIKANCLCKLGNFKVAFDYYNRYNNVAPQDGYSEMCLGTVLLHLSQYDEALVHLQKAIQQSDEHNTDQIQQIYETLAFAYCSLCIYDKAIECVEKVNIDENDIEGTAEKLLIKGHILLESGQAQKAEAMFRDAIIKSSNSPKIILRVIVSLMDNNYTDIAYNMFKIYFSMMGDTNEGYSYMALCCWELQKNEEFLTYFKKAIINNPLEVKNVLSAIIPTGMTPTEFLKEINEQINRYRK